MPTRLRYPNVCSPTENRSFTVAYVRDNVHVTFGVMTFHYRITSVFYVCDVDLCNNDSKFQTSLVPLFVNKISNVGMRFVEMFCFAHLPLTLPCSDREKKAFEKLYGDGM